MSRFRVLWIDDQKTKCKRDVIAVSRIIDSLGFEPDIQVEDDISFESLTNSEGALYKAINARNIDLFVVDYNLKNDLFGNDVVKEIRNNNNIYTDIVFYSSASESLISAVKSSFDAESIMDYCDGVYIAPLGEEFIEKIRYVITKIIKSWYNVHSIRGVLLSKASKFEQMVTEIIDNNYIVCLETIKSRLKVKGTNVCQTTYEKWDNVNQLQDPVPQILKDPINFNWAVKKMLLKELDDNNIVSIATWEQIDKIFRLRNKFAHNPIHLQDGVLVLTTSSGDEFYTEKEIDDIRNILSVVENDLAKILTKNNKNSDNTGFEDAVQKEFYVFNMGIKV